MSGVVRLKVKSLISGVVLALIKGFCVAFHVLHK